MSAPAGYRVHVPDEWTFKGYVRSLKTHFDFESVYTKDGQEKRESELLESGIACYRRQLTKHTVHDIYL